MAEKGKVVTSPVPVQSPSSGDSKTNFISKHKYAVAAGAGLGVVGLYALYEHFHNSSSTTTVPTSSTTSGSGSSGSSGNSGSSGSSGGTGSSGSGGYTGGYGSGGGGSSPVDLTGLQNSITQQTQQNQSLISSLTSAITSAISGLTNAVSNNSSNSNTTPNSVTNNYYSGGGTGGGTKVAKQTPVIVSHSQSSQTKKESNPPVQHVQPIPAYGPVPVNNQQANQYAAAGWRGSGGVTSYQGVTSVSTPNIAANNPTPPPVQHVSPIPTYGPTPKNNQQANKFAAAGWRG